MCLIHEQGVDKTTFESMKPLRKITFRFVKDGGESTDERETSDEDGYLSLNMTTKGNDVNMKISVEQQTLRSVS